MENTTTEEETAPFLTRLSLLFHVATCSCFWFRGFFRFCPPCECRFILAQSVRVVSWNHLVCNLSLCVLIRYLYSWPLCWSSTRVRLQGIFKKFGPMCKPLLGTMSQVSVLSMDCLDDLCRPPHIGFRTGYGMWRSLWCCMSNGIWDRSDLNDYRRCGCVAPHHEFHHCHR